MENIIRKGIVEQFYFSYYWGFYFSAGYLFYKKLNNSLSLMSFPKLCIQ